MIAFFIGLWVGAALGYIIRVLLVRANSTWYEP